MWDLLLRHGVTEKVHNFMVRHQALRTLAAPHVELNGKPYLQIENLACTVAYLAEGIWHLRTFLHTFCCTQL